MKSVDTVCDIICIEKEGEKLCQVTIQSTQKNLENKLQILNLKVIVIVCYIINQNSLNFKK